MYLFEVLLKYKDGCMIKLSKLNKLSQANYFINNNVFILIKLTVSIYNLRFIIYQKKQITRTHTYLKKPNHDAIIS